MKKHLILLSVVVMFMVTSCSTFQYATVGSELSRNDLNQFIYENDSISVKYWFEGENCPVKIEVFNKLSRPIFVNWRKSALITNNVRYAYWKDEALLNGMITGSEIQWTNYFSTSTANVQGSISRQEQISFIPPGSLISMSPLQVKNQLFAVPVPPAGQKVTMNSNGQKGRKYLYMKETTPLEFRIYLTLSLTDDFKDTIYLDHKFWVSDITQSNAKPSSFTNKSTNNRFYVKKGNNNTAAFVVLCIPVVLGVAFLNSL